MDTMKSFGRLMTLDLLRGYFLLVIILNHLHFYPSGLEWITGQSFLYVSAAEGFFLISGIVLGIVRGAKLLEKPFRFAASLLLKRSVQLYVTSVILVVLFTLIGWLFAGEPGVKFGVFQPVGDFWTMLYKTLTFQYLYGWADYLRLYAIFLFFSPLVLWLLRRGLWYVVLLASVGVWLLYPLVPIPDGEMSQPFSWQLVFFVGFVIGFYWPRLRKWWDELRPRLRTAAVYGIVTFAVITLVANVLLVFGGDLPGIGTWLAEMNVRIGELFDKDRLPVPRLLLFAVWFVALAAAFSRFQNQIKRWAGWLLLSFGTNSLYVYTIQAFVVFFAHLLFDEASDFWLANLAISIGIVGMTYLAVRTRFLMKIIPR